MTQSIKSLRSTPVVAKTINSAGSDASALPPPVGTSAELSDRDLDKVAGGAFNLVPVKTVSWTHDDESPKETVTFEYGAP